MQITIWKISKATNVLFSFAAVFILLSFEQAFLSSLTLVSIFLSVSILFAVVLQKSERAHSSLALLVLIFFQGFYQLRILTLLAGFPSSILQRGLYSDHTVQLAYIYSALVFFSVCWGACAEKTRRITVFKELGSKIPFNIFLWVFIFCFVLSFLFRFFPLPPEGLRLTSYVLSVFSPLTAFSALLIAFSLNWDRLSRTQVTATLIPFLLFALDCILSGKRSTLLTMSLILFFSWGLSRFKVFINLKRGIIFLFLIVVFLVQFDASDFIRKSEKKDINLKNFSSRLLSSRYNDKATYAELFDRLAFLDATVDIIAYEDRYREILNPRYLLASTFDNNSPFKEVSSKLVRVSHGLKYMYYAGYTPTKLDVDRDYQSDVITLPAQLWVVFGPLCGLVIAYLLGCFFSFFDNYNELGRMTFSGAVSLLYFYVFVVNDFGLDWTLIETFRIIVLCLFYFFLAGFWDRVQPWFRLKLLFKNSSRA